MGIRQESTDWHIAAKTSDDVIDQLLKNRGIDDREAFLHPNYELGSHDPWLLPNIQKAIDRILQAIKGKESIVVYADYDADGIPGGALLKKVLAANGATVTHYIPNRLTEGYGLHAASIDALAENGAKLIITVDLGITNRAEVAHAARRGIDVIITDHHHVDLDRLPLDAVAIVHPALPGSSYPFAGLAGGGVAWKLVQALAEQTGKPTPNELKWWLEFAAISTVCDMMPLVDENRTIVHFGLKVLQRSKNLGLQALYAAGGITANEISAHTLGFQIGPRINAPGRMTGESTSFDLLTSTDPTLAYQLASGIERHNQARRSTLEAMLNDSHEQLRQFNGEIPPAIVVLNPAWSVGLAGLVASRLLQEFQRPVIALAGGDHGTLRGSARSPIGINILDTITRHQHYLLTFGGHEQAAGLHIQSQNVADFTREFTAAMANQTTGDNSGQSADAILSGQVVSMALARQLETLAPFGQGNQRPLFVIPNLRVRDITTIGKQRTHARFSFQEHSFGGIGFGLAETASQFRAGDTIDVLAHLGVNRWNGSEAVQLEIVSLRPASTVAS